MSALSTSQHPSHSSNRLIPATSTVGIVAFVMMSIAALLMAPAAATLHPLPTAGFNASIHSGTTEAFSVPGDSYQISSSGNHFAAISGTDVTYYSLPSGNHPTPALLWSGSCTDPLFWGERLICSSTVISPDGSSTDVPALHAGTFITGSRETMVIAQVLPTKINGATTATLKGIALDGTIRWESPLIFNRSSIGGQVHLNKATVGTFFTATSYDNAQGNNPQARVIAIDDGEDLHTYDGAYLLFGLTDGWATLSTGSDADADVNTIYSLDGTEVYQGPQNMNRNSDNPQADSPSFNPDYMDVDTMREMMEVSDNMAKTVVFTDGHYLPYSGVTRGPNACDTLTIDEHTWSISDLTGNVGNYQCKVSLHALGPQSILVTSEALNTPSQLLDLADGGVWWTTDISTLQIARIGLLIGVRSGDKGNTIVGLTAN